jgi:hypothetical protein
MEKILHHANATAIPCENIYFLENKNTAENTILPANQ